MKMTIQRLALCAIQVSFLFTMSARAEVIFGDGAQVIDQTPNFGDFVLVLNVPQSPITGDYSVPEAGFVRLLHAGNDSVLTVNGGSTLRAGFGLFTTTFDPITFELTLADNSNVFVDGPGSRIQIGSDTFLRGSIRLNGKGDFDITNGGVVNWIEPNSCDGSFQACDILIGATSGSNTGISVSGDGSVLDASNTNGRLWVGFDPSTVPYDPVDPPVGTLDSDDFFVIENGGTVLSNGGGVGKGFQGTEWTAEGVGFVHGTAIINNGGAWYLTQSSLKDSIALNVGEGEGGSGNVIVANGGLLDITANPGGEAGIYLGQKPGGRTVEGSNLLLIDGAGSMVNVDDNADFFNGSRIANGFATVQNEGALLIDSTVFVIDGTSDAPLSLFNTELASRAAGVTGLSNRNLDVLSGGSVVITDSDAQGISALLIAPGGLSTEFASVRVSGVGSSITVSNDPGVAKIPLDASFEDDNGDPSIPNVFVPIVSNIGTGTLDIEAGGSVTFENGDFVIAARAGDEADVTVTASTLTADRVIVGWFDYEGGPVTQGVSTGTLTLDIGIVNGDVVVDDNGELRGIGAINGTLFAEGGVIDPGFSPGTITVESLVLGAGSELIMEVGLNPDGTINAAASDSIVATSGDLNLSAGEVTFELSSVDPDTSLAEILGTAETLSVEDLFVTGEGSSVVLESYSFGSDFEKDDCKKDGWQNLNRGDATPFEQQGDCIQYVNTGK